MKGGEAGTDVIFAKRLARYLSEAGVLLKPFYMKADTSIRQLARELGELKREIQNFRPHIIHPQYCTVSSFLCVLATNLPVVATYRGSDLNPCPSMDWWRWVTGYLLSQVAAWRAAKIICVSQELKNRLWNGQHKTTVIPTGVDTQAFYPLPREAARARLGWGLEERVVLFNAGKEPMIKRLDLAQLAVDYAQTICGPIRFVVLNYQIEPDEIPTLMNASNCLLLTSDWEGSPTVVQEALACNLPVVTVEVGDVREVLNCDRVSRIVARDPGELGRAVAEICTRGQRSNGDEVVKKLSLEAIAARTVSVYREIMG